MIKQRDKHVPEKWHLLYVLNRDNHQNTRLTPQTRERTYQWQKFDQPRMWCDRGIMRLWGVSQSPRKYYKLGRQVGHSLSWLILEIQLSQLAPWPTWKFSRHKWYQNDAHQISWYFPRRHGYVEGGPFGDSSAQSPRLAVVPAFYTFYSITSWSSTERVIVGRSRNVFHRNNSPPPGTYRHRWHLEVIRGQRISEH